MKNKRIMSKRGITLIALVITIIVLLILAGISITMLFGENGIIIRANEAKEREETSKIEEQIKIAIMSSLTEDKIFDLEGFKQEIEKQGNSIVSEDENEIVISGGKVSVSVDVKTGEIKDIKNIQDILSISSEIIPKNEITSPK